MEAEERPLKIRKLDAETFEGESLLQPGIGRERLPSPTLSSNSQEHVREPIHAQANGVEANEEQEEAQDSNSPSSQDAVAHAMADGDEEPGQGETLLSKNQLKKLRNKERWEARREERKLKRKVKTQEKRLRNRTVKAEAHAAAKARAAANGNGVETFLSRPRRRRHTLLPITFVLDCGFDGLMTEKERISLGAQLTRCYSDNYKSPFQAHIIVSSWGGQLKHRFDTVLERHHESWRGVKFIAEDFVSAVDRAQVFMREKGGGAMVGAFAGGREDETDGTTAAAADALQDSPEKGPAEIVYLTSDSPHTLDRLKPYSTYIIGGLVDKNRHKGICYKTACDKGIRTAKLPIAEYMEMQSRFVLATNHVVEIMIRWLECADWGESFMKVMPKRKGGKLKGVGNDTQKPANSGDGVSIRVADSEENVSSETEEHESDQAQDEKGADS